MLRYFAILLLFFAIPAPLFAEVCDVERPYWQPGSPPVTVWTKPAWTLTNPVIVILIMLACTALWTRNRWLSFPLSVPWLLLTLVVITTHTDPSGAHDYARRDVCLGSPYLRILLAALMTLALARKAILGPPKHI